MLLHIIALRSTPQCYTIHRLDSFIWIVVWRQHCIFFGTLHCLHLAGFKKNVGRFGPFSHVCPLIIPLRAPLNSEVMPVELGQNITTSSTRDSNHDIFQPSVATDHRPSWPKIQTGQWISQWSQLANYFLSKAYSKHSKTSLTGCLYDQVLNPTLFGKHFRTTTGAGQQTERHKMRSSQKRKIRIKYK